MFQVLGVPASDEKIGKKALRLNELKILGLPVPSGVVVSSASFSREELRNFVMDKIKFPVAVRSSGKLEDLGNASFAGMYETFLGVSDIESVLEKARYCFDSATTDRVRHYLEGKKLHIPPEELASSMSVLIQEMVDAKISGVLFTVDPQTGREEEFYLDFCDGLGDQLVSGLVPASRVRVNIQSKMIHRLHEVEGSLRLQEEHLQELIAWAQKIQRFYGCPQDIEWCLDHQNKIWILQARPITTFNWRSDVPELTNADFKDGGISARVCTPFMYSVYQRALQKSMGEYFQKIGLVSHPDAYQWIYLFYGRAYWNAQAVKECLLTVPGFDERKFDRDLGIVKDYARFPARTSSVSARTILKALNVVSRIGFEYQDCMRMVSDFRPWFEVQDAQLKRLVHEVRDLSTAAFNDLLFQVQAFQFGVEASYFRVIYNNSNIQSEIKSSIKDDALILSFISELPLVAHASIASGLKSLSEALHQFGPESSEAQAELRRFLAENYHHGDCELDLTVPRWGEVPEQVQAMALSYQDHPRSRKSEFSALWDEYVNRQPLWWRWLVQPRLSGKLQLAREYLMVREEMRTYSTRAYYLLRLMLLELNRRAGLSPNQIFLYKIDEIQDLGSVSTDELNYRELMYESYRNFSPPNEFGGEIPSRKSDTSGSGLQGIGCSRGIVRGRVRVILDVAQSQLLEADEILVTRFTDPGWTPVMVRAKAIVTEVGGILSHAAVISREFGIPAVLNVTDVTRVLKTGDLIEVDGTTGSLLRLEHESKS